jgi:4-hydroxybenzoate polyprenyltransferase
VWAFTIACAAGFVASTLLFLWREPPNPWPLYLSGPVLLFVCGYSLAKRFTSLAHLWLGAALMLAPVAAWIAVKGLDDLTVPLILGAAVMGWVTGFDILYACQDAAFDQAEGLHSIPARLGVARSLRVAAACHAAMFALLVALGFASPHLGAVYFAGLAAVGLLLVYQHALVRPDDLSRVNRAFFHVNGVISVGLLVLVLVQLAVR